MIAAANGITFTTEQLLGPLGVVVLLFLGMSALTGIVIPFLFFNWKSVLNIQIKTIEAKLTACETREQRTQQETKVRERELQTQLTDLLKIVMEQQGQVGLVQKNQSEGMVPVGAMANIIAAMHSATPTQTQTQTGGGDTGKTGSVGPAGPAGPAGPPGPAGSGIGDVLPFLEEAKSVEGAPIHVDKGVVIPIEKPTE